MSNNNSHDKHSLKPRPSGYELRCCQCPNPLFAKEQVRSGGQMCIWCVLCGYQAQTRKHIDELPNGFAGVPEYDDLVKAQQKDDDGSE